MAGSEPGEPTDPVADTELTRPEDDPRTPISIEREDQLGDRSLAAAHHHEVIETARGQLTWAKAGVVVCFLSLLAAVTFGVSGWQRSDDPSVGAPTQVHAFDPSKFDFSDTDTDPAGWDVDVADGEPIDCVPSHLSTRVDASSCPGYGDPCFDGFGSHAVCPDIGQRRILMVARVIHMVPAPEHPSPTTTTEVPSSTPDPEPFWLVLDDGTQCRRFDNASELAVGGKRIEYLCSSAEGDGALLGLVDRTTSTWTVTYNGASSDELITKTVRSGWL